MTAVNWRRWIATALVVMTAGAIVTWLVGRQSTPHGLRVLAPSVELSIQGRPNASVSVATAGNFAAVVWGATEFGSGTDIYLAISRDGGETFGSPVRVNDVAGDASVNGEQPPRVALTERSGQDPSIVVIWTSTRPNGTALLHATSSDGGRSFEPSAAVPGSEGSGNRGWESAVATSTGRIVATWLDHREHATSSSAHSDAVDSMSEKSKLYVATLNEPTSGRAITGGVCYCCKTAMAAGPDGAVYIAWRHVYPGDFRDMALSTSLDEGRTFSAPLRISEDGWSVNGCPENGPAIVADRRNRVHVAWTTLVPGPPSGLNLFYATSTRGGPFTARRRLADRGTPSHVQMAIDGADRAALVWDEYANGARHIMLSQGDASSETLAFEAPIEIAGSTGGTYPAVAAVSQGLVIVWTQTVGDSSTIRLVRVAQ